MPFGASILLMVYMILIKNKNKNKNSPQSSLSLTAAEGSPKSPSPLLLLPSDVLQAAQLSLLPPFSTHLIHLVDLACSTGSHSLLKCRISDMLLLHCHISNFILDNLHLRQKNLLSLISLPPLHYHHFLPPPLLLPLYLFP